LPKDQGPGAGSLTVARNPRRVPILLRTFTPMVVLPRSIRLRAMELRI